VQEGLANIRKHARAKWARIRLTSENGRVRLEIADDGLGFNPEAMGRSEFPRFGLTTMRERAESLGGIWTLETAPGRGTRVVADIPYVRS
jgi:signal transduction histidine kinase